MSLVRARGGAMPRCFGCVVARAHKTSDVQEQTMHCMSTIDHEAADVSALCD